MRIYVGSMYIYKYIYIMILCTCTRYVSCKTINSHDALHCVWARFSGWPAHHDIYTEVWILIRYDMTGVYDVCAPCAGAVLVLFRYYFSFLFAGRCVRLTDGRSGSKG